MDTPVNREEFDGLGSRLSELREKHIECKTRVDSQIEYLISEQKELKNDMYEIRASLKDLTTQVQALTIKLTIAVGVIVTAINFLVPFLLKKLGG